MKPIGINPGGTVFVPWITGKKYVASIWGEIPIKSGVGN